jgi:hypothetical protein
MDRENGWISLTAGTTLCALSGLLLLVLIANWAQYHESLGPQSRSASADMPIVLRLLH